MTPEQRAEKIVSEWADGRSLHPLSTLEEMIAAEIQAAVDEAYKRGVEDEREECAKLVEAFYTWRDPLDEDTPTIYEISNKIRARSSGRICDQYHCGHEACNKAREEK